VLADLVEQRSGLLDVGQKAGQRFFEFAGVDGGSFFDAVSRVSG
jgi:hypothetical protein